MGHLIADSICAPAKSQLAQIARAHNESVPHVRETEQMAGSLSSLNVLKRHIVDIFAFRIAVFDVSQHLRTAWANVYFVGVAADGAHQLVCLLKRPLRSCETGHCIGQDIAAWKSE